MAEALLRAVGITKRFGSNVALDGVDFDVRPGEVHALIGENGAGKTTLMMVLAGVLTPDAGEVWVGDQRVQFGSPLDAQRWGIATVFQEFSVVPVVSVAENIFLHRPPTARIGGVIRRRELNRRARALLADLNVDLDPDAPAGSLPVGAVQLVEIAKALSLDARVLLLDEPTSALTEDEVASLLDVVRRLRERGKGIVLITHRLADAEAVADRYTVLKDGRRVGTYARSEVTRDDLVRLMVGREVQTAERNVSHDQEVLLAVDHLTASGVRDVSLRLHAGEILGVAGLQGSGRSELGEAIVGARRRTAGTVTFCGRPVRWRHPAEAVAAGVGYLPPDRKRQGLFLQQSVRANVVVAVLGQLSRWGVLRAGMATDVAETYRRQLGIRAPSVWSTVHALSGGNQQKVMVARWLAAERKVLVVDDPTVGIDTGAKAEIHRILIDLAASGAAVLLISSDLLELIALCNRIVVLREGIVAGELSGEAIGEEAVMQLAANDRTRAAG